VFDRINAQIDAGNKLREKYGNSVLVELAVNKIRLDREFVKDKSHKSRRVCHIIDSIKNQEELDLLRMVYREMLYVFGVFSPLEQREDNLKQAKNVIASSSKLKGLIEFSRSIHAEMHAILNAGRKLSGDKMIMGKLFVTTYPCHSCARHIVAAGIAEVYYIEPYRKSLATKLHGDAISERETDHEKVRLLPFSGVAPGRYLDLFRVPSDSRKGKDGLMIKLAPKDAWPRLEKSKEAFPTLEGLVVRSLAELKLIEAEGGEDGEGNTPPAA
jgi:deoxycytidylate deaminase